MLLSVSHRGIVFPKPGSDVLSIDVLFGDQRVWSVDLRELPSGPAAELPWPEPLRPFLTGSCVVTVQDSATEAPLFCVEHAFSEEPVQTAVLDESGNRLALNKWGRLGKTLNGADADFQRRIIARSAEIVQVLEQLGLRPFVVGGTLLGAVREQRLLPHDDDADIAYLSEHVHPADVALEGFEVGRRLVERGYTVVRHSATHMQIHFTADPGTSIDYYVDVFAAFFSADGFINQPFHVRGKMRPEQMVPFSEVSIEGVSFPAPADTDRWLTINYDANWLTPIPGFHLGTPRETQRRFQNWFGSFHFQRDFWNEMLPKLSDDLWKTGAQWLAQRNASFAAPTLVDLGSGAGKLTKTLATAEPSRRTIGLDYSSAALRLATQEPLPENLEFGHLNLYRTLSLGLTQQFGISGSFDVSMNHLLEQVGSDARDTIWRVVRASLDSGGSVAATAFTRPAPDVSFKDPTGWHLSEEQIVSEASAHGLRCEFVALSDTSPPGAKRAPVGIIFTVGTTPPNSYSQGEPLKSRMKRLLKRLTSSPATAEIEALNTRIASLEEEIDELRRDSLRVAELLDLAKQSFASAAQAETSQTPKQDELS